MAQAKEVESAPTEIQQEELAKAYGIKGVPLLSALRSLRFPQLFPYDFMHLIWENLIPNLILFWSGHFKEWMRVSHMSWIHIFGRSSVLYLQKLQK
jgi:hypothetical protein